MSPPTRQRRYVAREAWATAHARVDVHRAAGTAWIVLSGDLATQAGARLLLQQLRDAQRRLPDDIAVLHVDLTGLREVTLEVAVLLAVERRLGAVRGLTLATVLLGDVPVAPGARRVLDSLPAVTYGDLDDLRRALG